MTIHPSPTAVIVPAAGQGTRIGGERKQDRRLGDAPVLVQTLRAFEQHPDIGWIVVAAPAGERDEMARRLAEYGLSACLVVEGGASRRASVARALDALPDEVRYVLVHDAVRPFVTPGLITAVLDKARRWGAAVPAVPVADTVRRATDGVFGETVPRDGLFLVQTPQGFRRDWLAEAHAQHEMPDADVTDDAALVQHAGHAVHLVEGAPQNFKITTPDDWALARTRWESSSPS